MEGASVHECGIIMADMVNPPPIQHYHQMQADFAREHPEYWSLQYQQDDRFRYEMFPEALRKYQRVADSQIYTYGHILPSQDEYTFNPDYPFEHLLWAAVNSR